jgi:hypothetical protein
MVVDKRSRHEYNQRMDLGRDYLIRERARRSLSVAAMARQFGVTRSHMLYVLAGKRAITVRLAQAGRREYPELLTILVNQITAPQPEPLERVS